MDEGIKTLPDLLGDARFAMLTLGAATGLDARPLTIQRTDDHAVWFLVSDQTTWLADLDGDAGLTTADDRQWVSLSGSCDLVRDPVIIAGLGDPVSDAWFEEGQEPVALLFDVLRGEWWTSPNFARTVLEVARAKITGSTPEAGQHGAVA